MDNTAKGKPTFFILPSILHPSPCSALHFPIPIHTTQPPCHLPSNTQHRSRRAALDVHEWEGTFKGQPAFFKMTSVIGHVYSIDFPQQYNSWDKTDPNDLFEARTIRSEANPKV